MCSPAQRRWVAASAKRRRRLRHRMPASSSTRCSSLGCVRVGILPREHCKARRDAMAQRVEASCLVTFDCLCGGCFAVTAAQPHWASPHDLHPVSGGQRTKRYSRRASASAGAPIVVYSHIWHCGGVGLWRNQNGSARSQRTLLSNRDPVRSLALELCMMNHPLGARCTRAADATSASKPFRRR
jgi:hypothetical protein